MSQKEPEFIPEHKSFLLLRKIIPSILKIQKGHINMALDLLKQVLFQLYNTTDIQKLVDNSTKIDESMRFSDIAKKAIELVEWSYATKHTVFNNLKKILKETSVSDDFINRITVKSRKTGGCSILKKSLSGLHESNPKKKLLLNWIKLIKQNTKNRSDLSIKNIISFYIRILPTIGADLDSWDNSSIEKLKSLDREKVLQICGEKQVNKKIKWLSILCDNILKLQYPDKDIFKKVGMTAVSIFEDDGSDKHRLSVEEIEAIYDTVKDNCRDELFFLLLITTGMRIGGLVNIKLKNVCKITGDKIEIFDTGRTLEKGNKWFPFMLNEKVKRLIYVWIIKHRVSMNSEYLFPGNGETGHITTGTVRRFFRKWCSKAELSGSHLHPHSLRHSYAHILLELGNNVNTVSKLLGHSNTTTTENFYLKENAVEVAQRANIPWLNKNKKKKNVIPSFLAEKPRDIMDTKEKAVRRRRKTMAQLKLFNTQT